MLEASFKGSNISKETNIYGMFGNCSSLTSLDLRNFNTSNVTDMDNMFKGCNGLTSLDLSKWDMRSVETSGMFIGCNSLRTIRMKDCSETTINKIKAVKPSSATIVTE